LPAEYADLEIRILERRPEGYPVELVLDGELKFPHGYLAPDVLPWAPTANSVQDGERLFRLLFADERLRAAWAKIRGQTPRRRVRLRIDETARDLHAIPWELLREVGRGVPAQVLAASEATPFSRDLAGERRPVAPIAERPVKLLVAIASPDNLTDYVLPAIDVVAERRAIEAAVADLGEDDLKLRFLTAPVTLPGLEAALAEGGDHILHIVAHGRYHPHPGRAILFLADTANRVQRVGEETLAEALGRQRASLRLVFLASCQSARRNPANAFRGIASRLLVAGVPAVVAMQDLMPVTVSRAFSHTFYRQLLRHGLVDVAANQARSAGISAAAGGNWAAPVLFSRVPAGQIAAPRPAKPSWWQRLRRHPIVKPALAIRNAIIATLSLIALILGLSIDVETARQPGGALHRLWPATPTVAPLGSGFNVGVAPFAFQDASGRLTATVDSSQVGEWLFTAIDRELQQLPSALNVGRRGPAALPAILEGDREGRARRAAGIAAEHNLTMLIYGVLTKGPSGYQIEPEFYVSDAGFGYGSEVAGPSRLGRPVTVSLPLDPESSLKANQQLNARARTLQRIVGGLAHFYVRQYEQAWAAFQEAAAGAPPEGQEVLRTLLGAAKLRAADAQTDPAQRAQSLLQASEAFSQAYRLNRDYARSYLGLGAVALAQAQPGGGAVDAAKLAEASRWYSDSLGAADQPPTAYVPAKAAFGLAQAQLLGVEHGLPGWSEDEARSRFAQVVREYEAAPTLDLAWFAGHAHAALGWIARRGEDWSTMASECRKAIDVLDKLPNSPDYWIATYWSWLGFAEAHRGQRDSALAAYRRAIELGEGVVEPDTLAKWRNDRDRLERGQGVR
jgi:tetratricopeptide (TPR) repeat protein